MSRSNLGPLVAVAVAAAVMAVSSASASQSRSLAGGTYRVGWEQMEFDNMDPIGAYSDTFALFSNLLTRTLVGYDHVAGAAGAKFVPDLATSMPAPTNGGRTYTFKLKHDVRFGPPVNREITSQDIRYALERLARPANGAHYASYFDVIRGYAAYRRGKAASVAGIVTPDARTITFELVRPTGDFLHRLTLPGASPVPREVARCFEGKPRAYGSDLVSSGPYMIEGAGAVRIGSCDEIRPMRGISALQLSLVRNPRYDARTDVRAARENNPDRFVFLVEHLRGTGTAPDLIGKVNAGQLEDAILYVSPKVIGKYAEAARAHGRLRVNTPYWRYYLSMNLTQPPFDDVHVRKAMSWLVDRAAFRDSLGGPLAGPIPQHIVPDELLGGALKNFAPFKTPGDHGSLSRARTEMAKSNYKTRNGVCVVTACKHVFFTSIVDCTCYAVGQRIGPIIKAEAAKLGIGLAKHANNFDKVLEPSANIALTANVEWSSDYSDPADFLERLLAGTSIRPVQNWNTSLVGITPAQAKRLGVKGHVRGVPGVDADLARCSPLTGSPRLECYAALDRKLSTEIVPWIPFLWHSRINILGPQVAKWAFDQSAGTTAFAHVAVKG